MITPRERRGFVVFWSCYIGLMIACVALYFAV